MRGVTERILNAVAYREQCDVVDLPPLYEAVDPEALQQVVEDEAVAQIQFTYCGYQITAEQNGQIHITAEATAR